MLFGKAVAQIKLPDCKHQMEERVGGIGFGNCVKIFFEKEHVELVQAGGEEEVANVGN